MSRLKSKIKKDFLFHLEHFYRNYGNEWSLDEFPPIIKKNKDKIIALLPELEEKGILKLNEDQSFTILKLPSQLDI